MILDYSTEVTARNSRLRLTADASLLLGSVAFETSGENVDEKAVAILCAISSSLLGGLALNAKMHNAYCVAALTRQLVEIEYLIYAAFAEHKAIGEWYIANKQERAQSWAPRHLYNIVGSPFSKEEYQDHCEIGGHPTKRGAKLVRFNEHESEEVFCEALVHVRNILRYTHEWLAKHYPIRGKVEVDKWKELAQAFDQFLESDPGLTRLKKRHIVWTDAGSPRE